MLECFWTTLCISCRFCVSFEMDEILKNCPNGLWQKKSLLDFRKEREGEGDTVLLQEILSLLAIS